MSEGKQETQEPIPGELMVGDEYQPARLFKSVQEVEEEMVATKAQAQAHWDKADREKRPLNPAETMECDKLTRYYTKLREEEIPRARGHEEMVADGIRREIARDSVPGQALRVRENNIPRAGGSYLEANALPNMNYKPLGAFSKERFGSNQMAHQAAYDAGQFFKATLLGDHEARDYCLGRPHLSTDIDGGTRQLMQQVVATPSLGGYLVPEAVAATILDVRDRVSAIAKVARPYTMTEEVDNVPKRLSGLTVYKPADGGSQEVDQITPSTKTYGNVKLTATDAYTLTYISHKLIRGSVIDAVDDVISEIGYQFAAQQDFEGINGDGTANSPSWGIQGMIPNPGTGGIVDVGQVTLGNGLTGYDGIVQKNIHALIGLLPDRFHTRSAGASASGAMGEPAFMCSHKFFAEALAPLMTGAGGSGVSDVSNDIPFRYLGYPVVFTEQMPNTFAFGQTCLLFGNYYEGLMLGNREVVRVMLSDQFRFDYDQLAIKGRISYDLQFHEPGVTGTNAGAVVSLVTGAS